MSESPRYPNRNRVRQKRGVMNPSRAWPDGMSRHSPIRDRVNAAEEISRQALHLAQVARATGFAELCLALESVALNAASEAATARWPQDG